MKNTTILILLLSILVSINTHAQSGCDEVSSKNTFKVVFYNVENLFDTIDDPLTKDKEYLPDAKVFWNTERYNDKLEKISRVLTSIDSNNYPAVIGLSEVENKEVVSDLISKTPLKKGKYKIVHKNSPDERGIDVALIYRKKKFKLIKQQFIPIHFPNEPDDKTRDILYVKGLTKGKDTLHFFVNHWPSRWGGKEKSEPKRMYVARVLKSKVDSIFSKNLKANIVIIGDFNDDPTDKSISKVLKAQKVERTTYPGMLYNLSYKKFKSGEGSYYYSREKIWNMIDQIIVSGNLVSHQNKFRVDGYNACIFKADWLMFENSDGVKQPSRTKGRTYYGGYSDHFPVYVNLIMEK